MRKKHLAVLAATIVLSPLSVLNTQTPAHAGDASYYAGTWSGYTNNIDLSPSLEADALYGYDNGCAYGEFTHVALALEPSYYQSTATSDGHAAGWDGKIIESTSTGTSKSVITSRWQSHFYDYDAASLDYFSKSGYDFNSNAMISNAKSYQGVYDWTSSYSDNTSWYCSKLVSRSAYDYNGYNLGFMVWGSFIKPSDVWYDSADWERDYAVSAGYDGGSVYSIPATATAGAMSPSLSPSYTNVDSKAKTFTYKGVTIQAKSLNAEVTHAVDMALKNAAAAGKSAQGLSIVAPDAKPGLIHYVKGLIQNGKANKAQVEAKWNLTDADLQ